jgi:ATP phosphoribosyltransferase regulatory subunit
MFRHSRNYQGKLREFTQAGVELIGDGSSKADCEIINLAVESMAAAVGVKGMSGFRIDIGHADFLKGALEETGMCESDRAAVQSAIIGKNYVEVEELVDRLDMGERLKELFKNLPLLIGGAEVLDRAESLVTNEASLSAIKYLRDIYSYLESNGCGDYVSFDLGVIGTMDYYTGIIFRGYLRGVGSSVVDGGRYDKLVARFGVDLPAVGFAIKVNSVGMRG